MPYSPDYVLLLMRVCISAWAESQSNTGERSKRLPMSWVRNASASSCSNPQRVWFRNRKLRLKLQKRKFGVARERACGRHRALSVRGLDNSAHASVENAAVTQLSDFAVFTRSEVVPGIAAVAIRLYLVERKSAIGPIGHFDWDGPQRRQLFVQWTIRFVRVREPHRRGRNG
jgi:hypothetical protein